MGTLYRLLIRIMIMGPVHKSSIVDPIGYGHRSHDELALINPENADISAHGALQFRCAHALRPVVRDFQTMMRRAPFAIRGRLITQCIDGGV